MGPRSVDPVEYYGTCRGGYKLPTRRTSTWVGLLLKGLLDSVLDSLGYCAHPAKRREVLLSVTNWLERASGLTFLDSGR